MVETKELRLGNLVQAIDRRMASDTYEKYIDVEVGDVMCLGINAESDYYGGTVCEYSEEDIFPIPLTEEWLIKFGFKDDTENTSTGYESLQADKFYRIDTTFIVSYKNGIYRKYWEIDEDTFYSWHGIEIKYVHQLQNLYFSLTGKELELTKP